jgi:CheY-like chemotaxis protein
MIFSKYQTAFWLQKMMNLILCLSKPFLCALGYDIIRAGNGREAVQLHMKYPEICLILMDLQMPVMDGYAATKKIRELDKLIPVIAQTAFVMPGVKEKAFRSGCNAFLTKPIDPGGFNYPNQLFAG